MPSLQIDWYQANDGQPLVSRVWNCTNQPVAHVVLLHGIVSHGGWYSASCAELAAAGCKVHFLERRGSGLNASGRGDIDHWETWPADVECYLQQLDSKVPKLLGGISWGGKLAVAVTKRHPELVQGLALLCPGIFAYQQPRLLKRSLLSALRGRQLLGRTVPVPLRDPALFTNDPVHQAYILNDPLALRRISLRFAQNDQQLTEFARQAADGEQTGWPPSLLVLAGKDRIVDPQATKQFFDRLSTTDKSILEYPSAAHTLEFEPRPEGYFRDLKHWVLRVAETQAN